VLWGLTVVLLSGCGTGSGLSIPFFTKPAEGITIPVQQAKSLYATVRTYYLDWKARQDAKCQKNELSAAECVKLVATHEEFKKADFEIRRALDNPGVDLNLENIEKILRLAGAVAP